METSFDPIDLIEKNLVGFYASWATAKEIPVIHTNGSTVIFQDGKPWPSFILFPETRAGEERELVRKMKAEITDHVLPQFLICTDRPGNKAFMDCLADAGFRPVTIWSGMARLLDEPFKISLDPGLSVSEVDNPARAHLFTQIINQEVLRASFLDASEIQEGGPDSFHAFLGMYNNQFCCTSSMYISSQTAGLYFIATLPVFRKQGFGSLITAYAMQAAYSKGFSNLVLHATKAGKPLYARLGFKEFCRLIIFCLP